MSITTYNEICMFFFLVRTNIDFNIIMNKPVKLKAVND